MTATARIFRILAVKHFGHRQFCRTEVKAKEVEAESDPAEDRCWRMSPIGSAPRRRGSPVEEDSTRHVRFDERGWETERCRMAQATAPILDSTFCDIAGPRVNVRSWWRSRRARDLTATTTEFDPNRNPSRDEGGRLSQEI